MTVQVLSRRSTLLYDRPFPTLMGVGELCVNANSGEPGLYFSDSTNTSLFKAGPTFIGSSAPNLSPAGFTSLSRGESWLDTASTQILKIYDGSAWQTPKAVATISSGKPSNPVNGQLHYDKALSKLYIYESASSSWLAT
jgi:hypothetical protein